MKEQGAREFLGAFSKFRKAAISLFHCSSGCTNAPQCYVIRTLPVLLSLMLRWEYDMKMYLTGSGRDGDEWIHLVQDRGYCQALVFTGMNLRVSKLRGISLLDGEPTAYEAGLCSLALSGSFSSCIFL